VHRCDRCHGHWIDGKDVGWLYPALRHHGTRIVELLKLGARRESSFERCPRGHDDAIEFPFFDLWLDICESCHGLWIDGAETSFVERAATDSDGLPKLSERDGPYRTQKPTETRVSCGVCRNTVHPRRTYLTADGAVCDNCVEIEGMSTQLDDGSALSQLKRAPGKLLRFFGALLDSDGKRVKRSGFSNF